MIEPQRLIEELLEVGLIRGGTAVYYQRPLPAQCLPGGNPVHVRHYASGFSAGLVVLTPNCSSICGTLIPSASICCSKLKITVGPLCASRFNPFAFPPPWSITTRRSMLPIGAATAPKMLAEAFKISGS